MKTQHANFLLKSIPQIFLILFLFSGIIVLAQPGDNIRDVTPGYVGWMGNPDSLGVFIDDTWSEEEKDSARVAMERWNGAGGIPKFKEVDSSANAQITITKGDPGGDDLGAAEVSGDAATGKLTGVEITVKGNPAPLSLKEVFTHELGHALGLDDTNPVDNPDDVMKREGGSNGTDGNLSQHDTTQLTQCVESIVMLGQEPRDNLVAVFPDMAVPPGQYTDVTFELPDVYPPETVVVVESPADPLLSIEYSLLDGNLLYVGMFSDQAHGSGTIYFDITILPLSGIPSQFWGIYYLNHNPTPPITFVCPMEVTQIDGSVQVNWEEQHNYPFVNSLRSRLVVDGNTYYDVKPGGNYSIQLEPGPHMLELFVDDFQVNSAYSSMDIFVEEPILNAEILNWPDTPPNPCQGDGLIIDFSMVEVLNAEFTEWLVSPEESGIFDDISFTLNPEYAGDVIISLLAFATPPGFDAIASMEFEVYPLPDVNCPEYDPVCAGSDFIEFPIVEMGVYINEAGDIVTGFDPLTSGLYAFTLTVNEIPPPAWTKVGDGGFGDPNNVITFPNVGFSDYHYAGTENNITGGEIWRTSDGTIWNQVNIDGFGDPNNTYADPEVVFGDHLYAGTTNEVTGAEVWRTSDGTNWEQVNIDGYGDPNNVFTVPLVAFDGYLYTGTTNEVTGAEIWRTTDGITWDQVNIDGFGDPNNVYAEPGKFAVFEGGLYVGTWNEVTGPEVWRTSDGTFWLQVNDDGFGDPNNTGGHPSVVFKGNLYAGLWNEATGAQIWRTLDGTNWTQVVADGHGDPNNIYSGPLQIIEGNLYTGTQNDITGGEIWRTADGTNWTQVSTDGFGNLNNTVCCNNDKYTGTKNNFLLSGTVNESTGGEIWQAEIYSGCSASCDFTIEVVAQPFVYAGDDATIQDEETFVLADALASNCSTLAWTSSGDGIFDEPSSLNPTYTMGSDDIEIGKVDLCLFGEPFYPCIVVSEDCMELTIDTFEPTVPPWQDSFEDYALGSDIVGQENWESWSGGESSPSARVTNEQVHSGDQALKTMGDEDLTGDDIVHQFAGCNAGLWEVSTWQFIPNDASGGSTYFVLLDQYGNTQEDCHWATQIKFDTDLDIVESDYEGASLPLVKGEWAELKVVIDLDNDNQTIIYNGELLSSKSWTLGIPQAAPGISNIAAINMIANDLADYPVYYDDMMITDDLGDYPIITCPSDIETSNDPGICGATNIDLGQLEIEDPFGIDTVYNNAPLTFPVDSTTVTWTAINNIGGTASCDQIVTVLDTEDPEIPPLPDIESPNDPGECGAVVDWPPPDPTDNCEPPSLGSNYQPGDTFPVGETDVFYTATDQSGNQGYTGFTITVLDTNPPDMLCPDDFEVNVNAPSFELTEATPEGGWYEGPGVADGIFYPADAGIGNHLIIYNYNNPSSGCLYNCGFYIMVTEGEGQLIVIPEGWSGISGYVEPINPSLDVILSPIYDELVILRNNEGMYYPDEDINTLWWWDTYSGYIIKVENSVNLFIEGTEVSDKTLLLNPGWEIIPVLSTDFYNIVELFTGTPLTIVKEVAGSGIYWNDYGINTIEFVEPGKSYYVLMDGPAEISFNLPMDGKAGMVQKPEDQVETPWNPVSHTPSSHVIAFNFNGQVLSKGDIVAGFNQAGLCAGYTQLNDQDAPFALTVFGNVPFAGNDSGFESGELISYQLYRPASNETFKLEVSYNPEMNTGNFEVNGLSEVTSVKLAPLGILGLQAANINIYPNPNDGAFTIEGIEDLAEIKIFNAFGEEIYLSEKLLPTKIALTQAKGIYIIKIITKKGAHYGKIIIN